MKRLVASQKLAVLLTTVYLWISAVPSLASPLPKTIDTLTVTGINNPTCSNVSDETALRSCSVTQLYSISALPTGSDLILYTNFIAPENRRDVVHVLCQATAIRFFDNCTFTLSSTQNPSLFPPPPTPPIQLFCPPFCSPPPRELIIQPGPMDISSLWGLSSGSVTFESVPVVTPEPGSLMTIGIGGLMGVLFRWRRKSRSQTSPK